MFMLFVVLFGGMWMRAFVRVSVLCRECVLFDMRGGCSF